MSAATIKDSTHKTAEDEKQVTTLTSDISVFASAQAAVFAEQKAKVEQLTAETAGALVGLDGRLSAAVADTRASVTASFVAPNQRLHTWAVGVKAEVGQITDTLRARKGDAGPARAPGFEGKGTGAGIDKNEVAVGKLPDHFTKVQYRHWSNAVDIQLEAVHGWRCPDYILNRVKRSPDEMTAGVFARCLAEAAIDISKDDDIAAVAPDPSE